MHRAALLRRLRQQGPEEPLHVGIALAVHQQAEAMAAAHQGKRCFRRSEDGDTLHLWRRTAHAARVGLGILAGLGRDDDRGKPSEGRQHRPLPF